MIFNWPTADIQLTFQWYLWLWASMLWLIDSCQNKISAHRLRFKARFFLNFTSQLDCTLKPGYYYGGEAGSMWKGKILTPACCWLFFQHSCTIVLILWCWQVCNTMVQTRLSVLLRIFIFWWSNLDQKIYWHFFSMCRKAQL